MQNATRLVLGKEDTHRFAVADVDLFEAVAGIFGCRCQRLEVAGIGKFVDVNDRFIRLGEKPTDDSRAYEAGTTGNKESQSRPFRAKSGAGPNLAPWPT